MTGSLGRPYRLHLFDVEELGHDGLAHGLCCPTPALIDSIRVAAEHVFACVEEHNQYAMKAAMEGPTAPRGERVEEYSQLRDVAYEALHALGRVTVVRPQGAFSMDDISRLSRWLSELGEQR